MSSRRLSLGRSFRKKNSRTDTVAAATWASSPRKEAEADPSGEEVQPSVAELAKTFEALDGREYAPTPAIAAHISGRGKAVGPTKMVTPIRLLQSSFAAVDSLAMMKFRDGVMQAKEEYGYAFIELLPGSVADQDWFSRWLEQLDKCAGVVILATKAYWEKIETNPFDCACAKEATAILDRVERDPALKVFVMDPDTPNQGYNDLLMLLKDDEDGMNFTGWRKWILKHRENGPMRLRSEHSPMRPIADMPLAVTVACLPVRIAAGHYVKHLKSNKLLAQVKSSLQTSFGNKRMHVAITDGSPSHTKEKAKKSGVFVLVGMGVDARPTDAVKEPKYLAIGNEKIRDECFKGIPLAIVFLRYLFSYPT